MTQIATVERILDDTHVEISVPRKSACGAVWRLPSEISCRTRLMSRM